MKVKMKTFEELKEIVVPELMNDSDGKDFFILVHKDGLMGSIYPMMIKYLGEEIEVNLNINPDTYEMKEWINEESYFDIKIRSWMLVD